MDFHALYERYAPQVHRFALFLCGDAWLADDIASETFVRAWLSPEKIMQETVKAYLFTIARHLYYDALRSAKRYAPLDPSAHEAGASVQKDLEIKSELRTVLVAMQELAEPDRAALLMRAQDGMPYEEISQVLGMTVNNVKVRIHRARLRLMEARRPLGEMKRPGREQS